MVAALAAVSAVLVACGESGAGAAPGGGAPQAPPVSVAPAVQRQVQDNEEFSARLEAVQTVELRSRIAGTLEQVHFREGQRVARGALLFTIDPRPLAAEVARAEAQLAAASNTLALSRSEVARAEKLVPINGISAQELDQLRAAVRSAEAGVQAAQAGVTSARLNLGYTSITAPIAGRVSRAYVNAGNLVAAGDPVLTTLVASDKVHAWFDAPEALYLRFQRAARAGQPAPVQLGLVDEPGFPHTGKVDFVDNRLNPATATMRVRAVFDNANDRFTPGLSARIRLAGNAPYPAVLVPERAIGTDQTRKVVLTVGPNNIVAPREVKLGALIDGMRVVQGIDAGTMVIVDGTQRAFPGAPVAPTVLKVDERGMPIAAAPPGAPGAAAAPAAAASKPAAASASAGNAAGK
jgi:RND family efflux transporter MFP subunit